MPANRRPKKSKKNASTNSSGGSNSKERKKAVHLTLHDVDEMRLNLLAQDLEEAAQPFVEQLKEAGDSFTKSLQVLVHQYCTAGDDMHALWHAVGRDVGHDDPYLKMLMDGARFLGDSSEHKWTVLALMHMVRMRSQDTARVLECINALQPSLVALRIARYRGNNLSNFCVAMAAIDYIDVKDYQTKLRAINKKQASRLIQVLYQDAKSFVCRAVVDEKDARFGVVFAAMLETFMAGKAGDLEWRTMIEWVGRVCDANTALVNECVDATQKSLDNYIQSILL